MTVVQNKLIPVDYDGNGTLDLAFLLPIFPASTSEIIQAQLGVWLFEPGVGLPTVQGTVGGVFRYANGDFSELGDGFIPGFGGEVNDIIFDGPAPLFADFNGDGNTDQVFGSLVYADPFDDNTFQGYELGTWLQDGLNALSRQGIFLNSTGNIPLVLEEWANPFLYSISGQGPLGDFNGDGTTDIVFLREDISLGETEVAVWLIDNGGVSLQGTIDFADPGWSLNSTNDFDGNGTTDLLFVEGVEGSSTTVGIWLLDGAVATAQDVVGVADPGWEVFDTNDFDGDGSADIVFTQPGDGGTTNIGIWTIIGTQVNIQDVIGVADAGWSLVDHNDFNGDGKADLLFRQDLPGGQLYGVWLLDGANTPIAQQEVGFADTGWEFSISGDVNADGIADLVFYDDSTKEIGRWLFASDGFTSTQGFIDNYDNASEPLAWQPPFTQPLFDIPPFPNPLTT